MENVISCKLCWVGGQEEYHRLRPLSYPDTSFILMVYCVESRDTYDNCVSEWAPEVANFCPDVPIILVGAVHCNRSDFDNRDECDRPPSTRCVSKEEGKEAAKGMGKLTTAY